MKRANKITQPWLAACRWLPLWLLLGGSGLLAEQGVTTMKEPNRCDAQCGLPTDDAELRRLLTPEQYHIMKENGTEAPFQNAYWDNHEPGLYVDRISGVPLFSSLDKFDSGTGWPSFSKPLNAAALVEKKDNSHGMQRVEVRARLSDSHLGHVFPDGPAPTRLRYCMNSASLKFIPLNQLQQAGYGEYVKLFTPQGKP